MVARGKQCTARSTITPTKTCSGDLCRCIKRKVGAHLNEQHCKGNLVPSRKQATHKLRGSLSGPKRVPRPLLEQHSSHNHRLHHSGCLHKQRRRDEVGPCVCPSVENPDLVCQKAGYCKAQHIPG